VCGAERLRCFFLRSDLSLGKIVELSSFQPGIDVSSQCSYYFFCPTGFTAEKLPEGRPVPAMTPTSPFPLVRPFPRLLPGILEVFCVSWYGPGTPPPLVTRDPIRFGSGLFGTNLRSFHPCMKTPVPFPFFNVCSHYVSLRFSWLLLVAFFSTLSVFAISLGSPALQFSQDLQLPVCKAKPFLLWF